MSEQSPANNYKIESLEGNEVPSSSQVLDAFSEMKTALSDNVEEISNREGGFKLDANQLIAIKREEAAAKQELEGFNDAWVELGGAEIDAAQVVVDSLNFKSDANDHVKAKAQLRDARNAFYENFLASRESQVESIAQEEVASKAPRHRAEYQDEENPIADEVAASLGMDGATVREGESLEEYEARQPGRHRASTGADELELIDTADATRSADELEILKVDEPQATKRTWRDRARRARRAATPNGLAGEMSAWAATRNERGPRGRGYKLARGLGVAALLTGGGLLLLKGHDIFGGHSGGGPKDIPLDSVPTVDTAPPVDAVPPIDAVPTVETVRVNPNDGEIKILQSILSNHGLKVDTTQAQQIGEHARLHDILKADNSYSHSGSTMDRIGNTGRFAIKKNVVERALESAKELGIK